MGFKLSEDSYKYLKDLKKDKSAGEFKLDFDFYYLCAVLGMTFRRCNSFNSGKEITRNFPGKYDSYKYKIIALLLDAEKERTGTDDSNRKNFERFMLSYVDPKKETELSEEGEDRLNCYAEGGFQMISEKIGKVDKLDAFLILYHSLFSELK